MSMIFGGISLNLPPGIQFGFGSEEHDTICFRCGECCVKYRVRLSLVGAHRIADWLGLGFDDWLDRYTDKDWQQDKSFVLRWLNGECVFLERVKGSNKTCCLIHEVKPEVCKIWTPSLNRRECREGLAKYWSLTVSPSGQLEGAEEKLSGFYSFLKSLISSNDIESRYVVF